MSENNGQLVSGPDGSESQKTDKKPSRRVLTFSELYELRKWIELNWTWILEQKWTLDATAEKYVHEHPNTAPISAWHISSCVKKLNKQWPNRNKKEKAISPKLADSKKLRMVAASVVRILDVVHALCEDGGYPELLESLHAVRRASLVEIARSQKFTQTESPDNS